MDDLAKLIEAGLAGATVNIIVTRGKIFEHLREELDARSRFLGDLVHCPLCFGTWVGFLLGWLLKLRLFGVPWPVDWFFSSMAVTCLIVPFTFVIYASMHRILIDPPADND